MISSFQDFATLNTDPSVIEQTGFPIDPSGLPVDQSVFPVDSAFPSSDVFLTSGSSSQQPTDGSMTGGMGGFQMSSADIANQMGMTSTDTSVGATGGNSMINNNFMPDLPFGGSFVDLISGITLSFSPDVAGSGQTALSGNQINLGVNQPDTSQAMVNTGNIMDGSVTNPSLQHGGFDQAFNTGFDTLPTTLTTVLSGQDNVVSGQPINSLPADAFSLVPSVTFDVPSPGAPISLIPIQTATDPGGIAPDQVMGNEFSAGVPLGQPAPLGQIQPQRIGEPGTSGR